MINHHETQSRTSSPLLQCKCKIHHSLHRQRLQCVTLLQIHRIRFGFGLLQRTKQQRTRCHHSLQEILPREWLMNKQAKVGFANSLAQLKSTNTTTASYQSQSFPGIASRVEAAALPSTCWKGAVALWT